MNMNFSCNVPYLQPTGRLQGSHVATLVDAAEPTALLLRRLRRRRVGLRAYPVWCWPEDLRREAGWDGVSCSTFWARVETAGG